MWTWLARSHVRFDRFSLSEARRGDPLFTLLSLRLREDAARGDSAMTISSEVAAFAAGLRLWQHSHSDVSSYDAWGFVAIAIEAGGLGSFHPDAVQIAADAWMVEHFDHGLPDPTLGRDDEVTLTPLSAAGALAGWAWTATGTTLSVTLTKNTATEIVSRLRRLPR
jgi:hypothetical protein